MDKERKGIEKVEITSELATLANTLYESSYQNIVLYDENAHFSGECDGQIYDWEKEDINGALLSTDVLQEDDIMPVVISSNLRNSTNPSFPQVLECRYTLGDCWDISLSIAYSKTFKQNSYPVLKIKYCNNAERSAILTKEWENLFVVQKKILMRRLGLPGDIRPRVKYRVGERV